MKEKLTKEEKQKVKEIAAKVKAEFMKNFPEFMEKHIKEIAKLHPANMQEAPILPLQVQMNILNDTGAFLCETRKGKLGFRSEIMDKKKFPTRRLKTVAESLIGYGGMLGAVQKAVLDATEMVFAEYDSRCIGKEPSDRQLIKDEARRNSRFERFKRRHRFVQKGVTK